MKQTKKWSVAIVAGAAFVLACILVTVSGGFTYDTLMADGALTPTAWVYLPYIGKSVAWRPFSDDSPWNTPIGDSPTLDETIFVVALDPSTLDTRGQSETDTSVDFDYQIEGLPAGSYVIYAGTDRDDDGFICETGDLCGALPSTIEPEIITLEPGERRANADFSVARLLLQQSAAADLAGPISIHTAPTETTRP